ncbi:hypothetical protein J3F84DRAFT_395354 [Trichoderma pleuroticola]
MKSIHTHQVPIEKAGGLNDNDSARASATMRNRTPGPPSHIYFFAKPAHTTRNHMFSVKPALVTQIQHFDSQGHLEETIDVLSVGYWTSWFDKGIREFVRSKKCCPELVMMSENFYDVARLSKRLIGAALGKIDTSGNTASLWINNMSYTIFRGLGSSTYGFIEMYQLDGISDLLSIEFAGIQQRTTVEAMVLLTAVWVANQEGWIFPDEV